jgi:peptidoglycan hydrolase-like protein with peptidoglycan-binding domain
MKKINMKKVVGLTVVTSIMALAIAPSVSSAAVLYRQLQLGMSGADVSSLQTFLATDNTIYPQGLVTGYFGGLTKSAVSNFQSRNGIANVGRVGPQTLPIINAQMANGMGGGVNHSGSDFNAPMISNLGVSTSNSSATLSLMTNESASALVYYSTSPIPMTEASASSNVNISGPNQIMNIDLNTNHSTTIGGLMSNTTYYYVVYVRDGSGNESITMPSTFRTI